MVSDIFEYNRLFSKINSPRINFFLFRSLSFFNTIQKYFLIIHKKYVVCVIFLFIHIKFSLDFFFIWNIVFV